MRPGAVADRVQYDRRVLVTSRSFLEYEAFFALTPTDLDERLLDCCAGASGFAAAVRRRGGGAAAVDPAYGTGRRALFQQATASTTQVAKIVAQNDDSFTWSWYGSPARREELRRDARTAFIADLQAHPGNYVAGALPSLPFADNAFDLALCSHLIFTWADLLDEQWHLQSLFELLRVAPQVRVFPLVVQGTGDQVPFLTRVLDRLRGDGHRVEVRRVPYEFQRGANQMLTVERGGH